MGGGCILCAPLASDGRQRSRVSVPFLATPHTDVGEEKHGCIPGISCHRTCCVACVARRCRARAQLSELFSRANCQRRMIADGCQPLMDFHERPLAARPSERPLPEMSRTAQYTFGLAFVSEWEIKNQRQPLPYAVTLFSRTDATTSIYMSIYKTPTATARAAKPSDHRRSVCTFVGCCCCSSSSFLLFFLLSSH